MNIKKISELTGLSPSTIRYYEDQGLIKPLRKENNYREYTLDDVSLLKSIVVLQYVHFDLSSISYITKSIYADASKSCNDRVNTLFQNKISELVQMIDHYKIIIELLKTVPLTETSQDYHDHKEEIQNEIFSIVDKVFNHIKGDSNE